MHKTQTSTGKIFSVAYFYGELFERSEFLIGTSQKENPSVRVCVRLILVLVWKNIVLVLVWGTSERLVPAKKNRTPGTSERFVATAGSALPPVGRATPLLW